MEAGRQGGASSILAVILVQELTSKVESSCFSGSQRPARQDAASTSVCFFNSAFSLFSSRIFVVFNWSAGSNVMIPSSDES